MERRQSLNRRQTQSVSATPGGKRCLRHIGRGAIAYGLWVVAAAVFLWTVPVGAANGVDVVTAPNGGQINWTTGKVSAAGRFTVVEALRSGQLSSDDRLAAAVEDARANLLATLKKVRIDANTVVGNFSEERGAIIAELKHLVEETSVEKHAFLSDGSVKVTLEIDLFGAIAQLVLPEDIKQVTTIRPLKRKGDKPPDNPDTDRSTSSPGASAFSGLIVDARRITVQPALMPIIRDERGEEVYSAAFVSREYAVQNGVIQYSRDPEAAAVKARVGANPLVISALDTVGDEHSQLVVSDADAARVRGAYENLSLLKQCRVSVIVD